jgi:hypothetical protein
MISPKMNPEIKQLWIDALRSGQYKQGRGKLKTETDGVCYYCCLGVLCELYQKEHPQTEIYEEKIYKEEPNKKICYFGGSCSYLPQEVANWAELTSRDPSLKGMNGLGVSCSSSASDWNDLAGVAFSAIADMVEKTL